MEDNHSLTFELVNDKAELEKSLEYLLSWLDTHWYEINEDNQDLRMAIRTMIELVPRLMASYEDALQLTYTLADAWESYMNDQTPAGLYVP